MAISRAEIDNELAKLKRALAESLESADNTHFVADGRVLSRLEDLLEAQADARAVALAGSIPEQTKLLSSVEAFDSVLEDQNAIIQAANSRLQACVSAARAAVDDSGRGLEASRSAALRLLNHSHRLAYTSFAPLLGDHLIYEGVYQPPFPSTFHMQLARLSSFAEKRATEKEQALQQQRVQGTAELPVLSLSDLPPIPPGWRPGDPVPIFPPGWKPGDPIPQPAQPATETKEERGPEAAEEKEDEEMRMQPLFDLDTGIDDDFILNTEAVESESQESLGGDNDMSGSD